MHAVRIVFVLLMLGMWIAAWCMSVTQHDRDGMRSAVLMICLTLWGWRRYNGSLIG